MSKPVKVLAAVLLVSAAVVLAIVLPSGRAAAAATKAATCPDNSSGITYAKWTVVCTGQTALGATVKISPVTMDGLPISVKVPDTDTFVSASTGFDTQTATAQIVLTSQSTGSQAYVEITVTPPGGKEPGGTAAAKPSPQAPAKFYRLVFRP